LSLAIDGVAQAEVGLSCPPPQRVGISFSVVRPPWYFLGG
jgi:hypothetical protein